MVDQKDSLAIKDDTYLPTNLICLHRNYQLTRTPTIREFRINLFIQFFIDRVKEFRINLFIQFFIDRVKTLGSWIKEYNSESNDPYRVHFE